MSVSVYRLAYRNLKPLFLMLCDEHLAKRLANKASLLEKRRAFDGAKCGDCEHAKGRVS
jgi:hypothetical protein